MATGFNKIYKRFYSKITDDMYMELDQAQTDTLVFELLENAIDWFEFPRVDLSRYDKDNECFNITLSNEEINILAIYMVVAWLDQQLATIENVRMKYSGSDFKFTSQANHISKLTALRKEYERIGFHLQRLYKRRKVDENGVFKSTFGSIMSASVRKGNVSLVSSSSTSSNNNSANDSWNDMSNEDDAPSIDSGKDNWDDMESLPELPTVNDKKEDDNWDSM